MANSFSLRMQVYGAVTEAECETNRKNAKKQALLELHRLLRL